MHSSSQDFLRIPIFKILQFKINYISVVILSVLWQNINFWKAAYIYLKSS